MYGSPVESYRRALRHARQHASKAEELSQRLERLADRLQTMERRNKKSIPRSVGYRTTAEYVQKGSQHVSTTQTPIEQWPEIQAMLDRVRISGEEACVAYHPTTGMPSPSRVSRGCPDISVKTTWRASRKRKRTHGDEPNLNSTNHRNTVTNYRTGCIGAKRARRLLHCYVHNVHVQIPIITLDHVKPVFEQFLKEMEPQRVSTDSTAEETTLQRSRSSGMGMEISYSY